MLVDGKKVLQYNEPPGAQAGKDFERKLSEGTFALQGHDPKSVVRYKNIRVKRSTSCDWSASARPLRLGLAPSSLTEICLNSAVPACSSSSKSTISVDTMTAPAARMRSRPNR